MSSEIKQFLLTLAATTFSIVLTFGTTAIIDRKKERTNLEQCMRIMKVTDKDLDAFSLQQQELLEATRSKTSEDPSFSTDYSQRKSRLEKARTEGK